MRKSILTLLSVAVISTLSFNVLARAPGGGGGGGGFNHGSAQERSQNSQSESNSNGRFATDRDWTSPNNVDIFQCPNCCCSN